MIRWRTHFLAALALLLLVSVVGVAERYAVLIEGDSPAWFDEFWNDTLLMYEILIDDGFHPDNIFLLFNQGTDFVSANPRYVPGVGENSHLPATLTKFPADLASVNLVFNGLANGDPAHGIPAMTKDDFLFVWTFDHGGCDGPHGMCTSTAPVFLCLINNEKIYDQDFANLVDQIPYARRMFVMQQCFGGGFIPFLENSDTVILTASGRAPAYRADDIPTTENEVVAGVTYHHGEFDFHVMNALHWLTPVRAPITGQDTNGNRVVSAKEASNWVNTHDSQTEVPQYSDIGSHGNVLHLTSDEPSYSTDVFMRSHGMLAGAMGFLRPPDDGATPSNRHGEHLWRSPDILISLSPTGLPVIPNPVYGSTNYLYSNIYNFNEATEGSMTVEFYWADPTIGLQWPTDWTSIGTGTLASLGPGGHGVSDPAAVPWSPPSPATNAHYCLLAILDSPNDPLSSSVGSTVPVWELVANDNHIIWRNVTVIRFKAGYSETFELTLSNPLLEPADIEIRPIGLPEGWEIDLAIEGEARSYTAREFGEDGLCVMLDPDEKTRLAVTLRIPEDSEIRQDVSIDLVAISRGGVIGGYTFVVTKEIKQD